MLAVTYEADEFLQPLPIDAVLVLDVSLSMQTADPNQISREAMNLFIGRLGEYDRVGVVSYAGQVIDSRPITAIEDEYIKEDLQQFVKNLAYASWTDHGLGLLEAIRIMRYSLEENRRPIIIFFTDGNLSINPLGSRTVHEAEYDIAAALDLARQYDFPIYTIGLNVDGSLDRGLIDNIADTTGGVSFETTEAEEIPGIIETIFSVVQPAVIVPVEIPMPAPPTPPVTEEIDEVEPARQTWIFAVVIGALTGLLLCTRFTRPKRVFTGKVILETTGQQPITRNLIEYGRYTTLQRLIGGGNFDSIIICPSPTAPSHLPQLLIKCKHPKVTFIKDFIEQDKAAGVALSLGTEMTVSFEDVQVRLRYVE